MRNGVVVLSGLAMSTLAAVTAAQANPQTDLVCFNRDTSMSVRIDAGASTAFLRLDGAQYALAKSPDSGALFRYSGRGFELAGALPEAQLRSNGAFFASCHETIDSVRARALAGKTGFGWSDYAAKGRASQTVRAAPSPLSDRIASLPSGSPVTILENTGQFLDGFFWFRIRYDRTKTGYVWGALLCAETPEESKELAETVRKCAS